MQDLGSVFQGLAITKAPFNCSSGSEGTNTNLPELVPSRSPLEMLCAAAAFLNRGPKGPTTRFAGIWPLVGARATHMVPEAHWAVNHLAVLLLWHSRLATIASPREFGLALTSYCTHHRTSNFPTDGANCRDSVFGPGPLQWICREWVQKLGSDEATTCFWGWKIHRIGRLNVPRRKDPSLEDRSSQLLSHPKSLSPFSGPPSSWPSPPTLGDLCYYISLSSVYPPPALVNHPCSYSSAHPIGHSF